MSLKSGRPVLDMAAPALAFAVLFLLLRAANQTPDGLSYALAVRSGVDMFHPHHLIYVPVARVIHLATGVDPITATLIQNLFWVIVLALAAWRLACRIFPGRTAPVLAAVGLLAVRGVMIYSVRIETYLPALACLTLATVLAAARPLRHGLLVFALAGAVLYHQTNVLFILPLLVLLRGAEPATPLRITGTVVRAAALVLVPYVLAARVQEPPVAFWAYVLDYARAPVEAWGNFGYFSPAGGSQLAVSQLRMILPVREAAAGWGSLGMILVLLFLVGWHLVHLRRGADQRQLRLFGLVFLAVYLLFFLWWMPADTDFFVATLLPLWLLGMILIADLPPAARWLPAGAAAVLVLAAGNLYFTILPMHRDPGPGRAQALALDRAAPAGAEIVAGYAVQQEMLYFTTRTRVHEGEGLERGFAAGPPPWEAAGPAPAVVVIDGLFLRRHLAQEPADTGFLGWLAGYDPRQETWLALRRLPAADGVVLGPQRQAAGSREQFRRGFLHWAESERP